MKKIYKGKFVDQNVYELALERINHAYDLFDQVVVLFSGGKDSTACLNLTYEVAKKRNKLPLEVIFFDEEAIPYETEEYVRRVSKREGINLKWYCVPTVLRNACSRKQPFWNPWNPQVKDKWVRPMPPEAITHDKIKNFEVLAMQDLHGWLFPPSEYGSVGVIMGIRGQESLSRRRAVSMKLKENYIVPSIGKTDKGNVWKVYPIYDWLTPDVWLAPKKYGWDYNKAYDLMEKAGVKQTFQRCSPPYGDEPIRQLHLYRECFPDIWDRMENRVEGSHTASLYATTELFSFGRKHKPKKPPHLTWEEAIKHYIRKYDKESQKILANRIQKEMQTHFNKTNEPILDYTPHYDTGVSWDFLLMLAIRGDFKNRRRPNMRIDWENRTRMQKVYYEALLEKGKENKNYAKWNRYATSKLRNMDTSGEVKSK